MPKIYYCGKLFVTMNECVAISYILSSYISLTRTCCQECGFCNFFKAEDPLLEPDELVEELKHLSKNGATEVVFVAGENPSDLPHIMIQLAKFGYTSFAEYVNVAIKEALALNLIPVLEIGYLNSFTLERFYKSGCSIRANLVAANLNKEEQALENAKNRTPVNGKAFVEALHQNQIPYTLCFNIGIGETEEERINYIKELGVYCSSDPFLQDIRIIPFQPSSCCKMYDRPPLPFDSVAKVLETAREAFPVHHISVPANIFSRFPDLIEQGLNDLGSLPIFSGDILHPTFTVPNVETIKARLRNKNCHLYERGTLSTPAVLNRPECYNAVSFTRALIENRNSAIISLIDNDHCFVCGKKNPFGLNIPVKSFIKGNSVTFTWVPGPNHQSYAGIVHGGILATLLDEAMGYAVMGEKIDRRIVTLEYTLNYRHPTPVGLPLKVVATIGGQRHSVITARGTIIAPDGTVLVEASGKFYEIIKTINPQNNPVNKEESKNETKQSTN